MKFGYAYKGMMKAFTDWIYTAAPAASQVVFPAKYKKNASVNTHQQSNMTRTACFSRKSEAALPVLEYIST